MAGSACVVGLRVRRAAARGRAARGAVDSSATTSTPLRVADLRGGRSGIKDVADAAVAGATFTSDPVAGADRSTHVICVPTPLHEEMPDLGAVKSAARAVATVVL